MIFFPFIVNKYVVGRYFETMNITYLNQISVSSFIYICMGLKLLFYSMDYDATAVIDFDAQMIS